MFEYLSRFASLLAYLLDGDRTFTLAFTLAVALVGVGATLLVTANFSEKEHVRAVWHRYANAGTAATTAGVLLLLNLDGWQPLGTSHAMGVYGMVAFMGVLVAIFGGPALINTLSSMVDRLSSPGMAAATHSLHSMFDGRTATTVPLQPATVHHFPPFNLDLGVVERQPATHRHRTATAA